jgi:hypothetical protein
MSVVKGKRTESKLEAQHLALKLRQELTTDLMLTFGFSQKRLEKNIAHAVAHLQDPAERESEEQRLLAMGQEFVTWLIGEERKTIHDLTRDISHHIRAANTISPVYMAEFVERRVEWDRAMEACNRLQDELQYIAEKIPTDKNRYMCHVLDAEHLYRMIKKLRQSDNQRFLPHIKE